MPAHMSGWHDALQPCTPASTSLARLRASPPARHRSRTYASTSYFTPDQVRSLDIAQRLGGVQDGVPYGHTSCVNALHFTHQGVLMSGSDDTNVCIWEPDAGDVWDGRADSVNVDMRLTGVIETGHTANIFSVKTPAFHPNRIFTAAGDRQVRVFDLHAQSTSSRASTNLPSRAARGPEWAVWSHADPRPTVESGRNAQLLRRHAALHGGGGGADSGGACTQVFRCHKGRAKRLEPEIGGMSVLSVAEDGDVRQMDLRVPHSCPSCPPPLLHLSFTLYSLSIPECAPHLLCVAGASPYAYLFDRRMLGRETYAEWGQVASGTNGRQGSQSLTRCVRRFGRETLDGKPPSEDDHVTAVKMSDFDGERLLVSYSADGVYLFNIHDTPGESHDEQRETTLGSTARRSARRTTAASSGRRRAAQKHSSLSQALKSGRRAGRDQGAELSRRILEHFFADGPTGLARTGVRAWRRNEVDELLSSVSSAEDDLATPAGTARYLRFPRPKGFRTSVELIDFDRSRLAVASAILRLQRLTLQQAETREATPGLAPTSQEVGDIVKRLREAVSQRRRSRPSPGEAEGGIDPAAATATTASTDLIGLTSEEDRASYEEMMRGWTDLEQAADWESDREIVAARERIWMGAWELMTSTPEEHASGSRVGGEESHVEGAGSGTRGEPGAALNERREATGHDAEGDRETEASDEAEEEEEDGEEEDEEDDEEDTANEDEDEEAQADTDEEEEGEDREVEDDEDGEEEEEESDYDGIFARQRENPERIERQAAIVTPRRSYRGHINVDTVKDVNFFGARSEYVVTGSDDGHFFVFSTDDSSLLGIWKGDESVTNVVIPHPHLPVLAASGIDDTVKLFAPRHRDGGEGAPRSSANRWAERESILETNRNQRRGRSGLGSRAMMSFLAQHFMGGGAAQRIIVGPDGEPTEECSVM